MILSRKSLVSSQQSGSRVSLTSGRSRAESKSNLVDFSVDEIFVQYSVPQIQKLQREYKNNYIKAKDDLHRLVGEKYRDLIKIAEDIDDLSVLSRKIDSQLTELSYKSLRHVEFGRNPLSKFERSVRTEKAIKSRQASHKTILNNIINNKLIGYDLSLQTDTLKKTSTLVAVAKVYYTIGKIFDKVLQENPYVNSNLQQLKENFISYLENKIASFSSSDQNSSGLDIKDIFQASANLNDSDSLDFISGFEDDAQELSDEEDNELIDSVHRGSSIPIVNVLIAYIVVNHDNPLLDTFEKISRKFIDLRYNYLENVVSSALANPTAEQTEMSVNFTVIFQYVEATCSYFDHFFIKLDPISNDLQNQLKHINSWKASDLVGFHNWFDEENIIFNSQSYKIDGDLAHIQGDLQKFGDFTYRIASQLIHNTEDGDLTHKASKVLSILQNFVFGLRKSEVIFLSNTSECHIVKLLSSGDVVSKLLLDVTSAITSYLASHRESLVNSEKSVANHVISELQDDGSLTTALELFTPAFVNMIDVDVDKYFETVLEISTSANPTIKSETHRNSCDELKHWFYGLENLLQSSTISGDNKLAKILHVILRKFKDVEGISASWGTFSAEKFSSTFEKLHNEQVALFRKELSLFIATIPSSLSQSSGNSSHLQFLLNLFIILEDNIDAVEDPKSSTTLHEEINQQTLSIHQQIFQGILSEKPSDESQDFLTLFSEALSTSAGELVTVPTKPGLRVHSLLYELSLSLLQSSRFRQHEVANLYTDVGVRENFVSVKNQWIRRDLIEALALKQISLRFQKNGESEITEVKDQIEELEATKSELNGEADFDLDLDDGWDQEEEDGWAEEADVAEDAEKSHVAKGAQLVQETNGSENGELKQLTELNEDVGEDELTKKNGGPEPEPENDEAPVSTKTSTDADGNTQIFSCAVANIAFLLSFTTPSGLTSADPDLQQYIASLEKASGLKLESSTLDIILRGVTEFYRSSKEMYIPLLVN